MGEGRRGRDSIHVFVIETKLYIILGLFKTMGRAGKNVQWGKILALIGRSKQDERMRGREPTACCSHFPFCNPLLSFPAVNKAADGPKSY